MKKQIAVLTLVFLFAIRPAFAQDSSRLNDLHEKVSKSERKEARAQKKLDKQQRKLSRKQAKVERKQKKLERRQNKTDKHRRNRRQEHRKLEDAAQGTTSFLLTTRYGIEADRRTRMVA